MNLDPLGFNQNTDPSGLNNYPALLAFETHESAPPNENWWDKTKRIIGEVGQARNASIAAAARPLGEIGASLITGTAALGPSIGSMLIPSQESIDNLINGNWNTFINPRIELQSRLNRARQAAGLFTYEPTNPEAKTILKPVNDVMGFLPKYGGEARDYYNSLADQAEKNSDLKTAEAWRYLATITDFSAEALNLYALSKAGKAGGILKEKVTPPEINLGDLSGDGKPYSITQFQAPQAPIVNRVGNPYPTAADAQSIMESKGLADTHEVIPYESGFALQRKGAQSLLQDLFDPLKLCKEPVPTQETPAPVKAQTAPISQGDITSSLKHDADVSLQNGPRYELVDPKTAESKVYRETKVPVSSDIFKIIGVPPGNVFADYEALRQKHPDQFATSGDVKDHVEYVMDKPTGFLPASKKEYTMFYRSNGGDKATIVEFNLKGGKYRVHSTYTLDKGQLEIKKQKAQRGVPEPGPANPTLTDINEPLTQGGGVPSDTRHVELFGSKIAPDNKNVNAKDQLANPAENASTQLPVQEAPIVNRVGNPYRTAADAQSIMENKGLADTHEVIPCEGGFALQRKSAQSFLQDLLDPLKLYEEPVPTQETPAPVKAQTPPISQSDITAQKNNDLFAVNEKRFVDSPDGGKDFGYMPEDIEKISNGKYPAAPIRLEKGTSSFGHDHISEERIQEIKSLGYKDELDMLNDVTRHYTQVYEQPNGRLLIVKKNGKSKYAAVELQKNGENYYGVTTWFVDEKPSRGKPYEERSGKKLLLDVARTTDSGKSAPFISASDNDRADENWRSGEDSFYNKEFSAFSVKPATEDLGQKQSGGTPSPIRNNNITHQNESVNDESTAAPTGVAPYTSFKKNPESTNYKFLDESAPTQLPAPQAPIVNRVGNPYRSVADAQRIMENKGLADTHEVIPYQNGYALQSKGAQALVQDLFDPLRLNKKLVTPEETPAPANTQSSRSISMPGIDTKEPWQMTQDELSLSHRTIIEKALSENKPVPAEALKDYPDLAIEQGKSIIDQMIKDHTDKPGAMYRDDVGTIEFPWGKEGNPKKKYSDGNGISHIIAKRNSEGLNGEEIARMMPEVIVKGEIGDVYGPPQGQRVNIKYGDHEAVLSLYKKGKEETWLLTGWKEKTPGVPEESNNLQDYAHQTSGSRSDVGAGVNNNLTPANDSVNSKHNKEGKNSQQGRIVPRGRINGQY